jgi:hypothetical protein
LMSPCIDGKRIVVKAPYESYILSRPSGQPDLVPIGLKIVRKYTWLLLTNDFGELATVVEQSTTKLRGVGE